MMPEHLYHSGKVYYERHINAIELAFPYPAFTFYWSDEWRATHCLCLNNVIIKQKLDVINC